MTLRTNTEYIAIHCSATKPSQDIGADTIRQWHLDKGWSDIGYNIVIRRNGRIEIGRPIDHRGAHVKGYNAVSIGVCMIGGIDKYGKSEDNFTKDQWEALATTVRFLKGMYPYAIVQGHRDFPGVKKDCPCFDAKAWAKVEGFA